MAKNSVHMTITSGQGLLWIKAAPMMRLAIELQCFCVALVVMTQVWILAYFGTDVFEKLIGDEICLPMLYLTAIIFGTICFVHPTYWRIAFCLMAYSVAGYFSTMVPNVAIRMLLSPELYGLLLTRPQSWGSDGDDGFQVWIPWSLGFLLHMQFCTTSLFVSVVCIRDMYKFRLPYSKTSFAQSGKPVTEGIQHSMQNFISIEPQLAVITVVTGEAQNTKGFFNPPNISKPATPAKYEETSLD